MHREERAKPSATEFDRLKARGDAKPGLLGVMCEEGFQKLRDSNGVIQRVARLLCRQAKECGQRSSAIRGRLRLLATGTGAAKLDAGWVRVCRKCRSPGQE